MYCFVCLFRADKSASGLAFRIPLLWKEISSNNEDIFLIINKSLYAKVLSDLDDKLKKKVFIIPEFMDFKLSSLIFTPFLLMYLIFFKKNYKFHLSVGGVYFMDFIRFVSKIINKNIVLHTSIGSKNLNMITNGDKKHRYYKLHENLLNKVDKVDSLYDPNGFPEYKNKFIQSPGSFSWKFNIDKINSIVFPKIKEKNIVFCGSLIDQKNYQLAIDGYKVFCRNYHSNNYPKLYIISPMVSNSLIEECEEFNKTNLGKIIFKNYQDLDNILRESYIFLSLQDYDNYPSQSLIEAMLFGCTIIATDFGETKKMVKEINGNTLIYKNKWKLADAIKNLLNKHHVVNYKNVDYILNNHNINVYADYFFKNFIKDDKCV